MNLCLENKQIYNILKLLKNIFRLKLDSPLRFFIVISNGYIIFVRLFFNNLKMIKEVDFFIYGQVLEIKNLK